MVEGAERRVEDTADVEEVGGRIERLEREVAELRTAMAGISGAASLN